MLCLKSLVLSHCILSFFFYGHTLMFFLYGSRVVMLVHMLKFYHLSISGQISVMFLVAVIPSRKLSGLPKVFYGGQLCHSIL